MLRGWQRAPERRRNCVRALLVAVADALPFAQEPRMLRARFEDALCGLVNARGIELRDGPPVMRPAEHMLSLDVSSGNLSLGAIDAIFDEDAVALDEWDADVLESARQLAALVLIVDRAHRAGFMGGSRHRPDGAAPIIGSSAGMQAVRERIDRVAATDFTVLIEGPIGR